MTAAQPDAHAADAYARERARTTFDKPLVLEAGAGTGKTATLVARLLTWCLVEGWERRSLQLILGAVPAALTRRVSEQAVARDVLRRVVAITFTEKAAAEMATRVSVALKALVDGTPLIGLDPAALPLDQDILVQRAAALRDVSDQLRVSTIHAFCRRILSEHALAAGLHPQFTVDADLQAMRHIADDLFREALDDELGRAKDAAPGPIERLIAAGRTTEQMAETLRTLVEEGVPDDALPESPLGKEAVQHSAQGLLVQLDAWCARVAPRLETGKNVRAARETLEALSGMRAALEDGPSFDVLATCVQNEALRKPLNRLRSWTKGDFTKAESSCFAGVETEVADASGALRRTVLHLRQIDAPVLEAACELLRPLVAEARQRGVRRGIESFSMLLRDTQRLLGSNDTVLDVVRESMDQLFVDEFQDTDPLQCDVLRRLALEPRESRAPSLFLVGDPKQSIYGWRAADLAAYDAFVQDVLDLGGEQHALTVNFRSCAPILEEVERLIRPVMEPTRGLQPPFQPLASPQGSTDTGWVDDHRRPVEHWVSWRPTDDGALDVDLSSEGARALEAAAIAADILDLHQQHGVRYRDMALLLRATTRQETYARALRERGIPSLVEKDRTYYQRREVLEAAALIRCVLDPADRLALVTWLRSPLVGIPDAALRPLFHGGLAEHLLRLEEPDRTVFRAIDQLASHVRSAQPVGIPGADALPGWTDGLAVAVRTLATCRRAVRDEPATLALDRLRTATLLRETESARFLGAHRRANVDRLFLDVERALGDPTQSRADVLRLVRTATEAERAEDVDAPGDDDVDAVRLLTIHKAKGLTFRHVYCINLHGKTRRDDSSSGTIVRRGEHGWECQILGTSTLGFEPIARRQRRVDAAESVRLLYVATTRPKDRLVLVGRWPNLAKDAPPVEEATAPIDLVRRRAGPMPAFLRQATTNEPVPIVDHHGVRWSLSEPRRGDVAPPEASPRTFDRQRWVDDAAVIARRRARCREDAGRHSVLAASAMHEVQAVTPSERTSRSLFDVSADHAAMVGTALHDVLERIDLSHPLRPQVEALHLQDLVSRLGTHAHDALEDLLRDALQRLAQSRLLTTLERLAPHVMGREVPMLLRSEPTMEEPDLPGFGGVPTISGTVDVLVRDPAGGLRVIDYKSDRITQPDQLAARTARHQPQLRLYVDAIARAFPHQRPVRSELWFLHADRVMPGPTVDD